MNKNYIKINKNIYLSPGGYIKYSFNRTMILTILVLFSFILFTPETYANTLPNYLQGGGDAVRTLGNFINGAINFLTALLWGIWTIFAILFAKDLMLGKDAEELKSKVFKLGGAALILLMISALPALFAGFAN